jgi:hypothetical protein
MVSYFEFNNFNFLARTFLFLRQLTSSAYLLEPQFFEINLFMFGTQRIIFLLLIQMVIRQETLLQLYSVIYFIWFDTNL